MNQPNATATHTDVSQGSQLDPQQLALLRGLRKGMLLPQLLRTYRDQSVTQVNELRAAAARSDADAVRVIAHTLKSASFSIGANAVGELCAQLEDNARSQQLTTIPSLFGQLVERHTALQAEIEQLLKSYPAP